MTTSNTTTNTTSNTTSNTTTNTTTFSEDVLESLTCSITGLIMKDPVQGNDGHTYERSAIEEWLNRSQTSPITREPMTINNLKVNTNIRYLCDKYHAQNRQKKPSTQSFKSVYDKIKLTNSLSFNNNKTKALLSFNIDETTFPKDFSHLPQDIILVIDHSGSMNQAIEAKDAGGNCVENGFTVQDIVNHSAKTIAKTLDKDSRLAIIIFDHSIDVLFELQLMVEVNKTKIDTLINTIKPNGQTNIYGALVKAIELLEARDDKSRNGSILMLTDGVPNISPARGIVETLKQLRISKNFSSPIYTFGFGYVLEKDLLYNISKIANGGHGHIPDGSMIATVFCNFIATILTTIVVNLQLHIKTSSQTSQTSQNSKLTISGDFQDKYDASTNVTTYDIGTFQYQQSRDIIINLPSSADAADCSFFYTYKIGDTLYKSEEYSLTPVNNSSNMQANNNFIYHEMRYFTINTLINIIKSKNLNDSMKVLSLLDALKQTLTLNNNTNDANNESVTKLISNIFGDASSVGQVKMCIENDAYYKKWGVYYLDQFIRSLNQQMKPNFKDMACDFGGLCFNEIVNRASDIFDSIPPPTPSIRSSLQSSSQSSSQNPLYRSLGGAAPSLASHYINMAVYNNPNGGCFSGDSKMLLANGDFKLVKDLKKGDKVLSLADPYDIKSGLKEAKIVCILKILTGGCVNMVSTNKGLKITPWHPIITHGIWMFPGNVFETKQENCDEIYSILLDNYFTFNLNGSWVIGIGHSYNLGILAHNYFGSVNIINDLASDNGWINGIVTIKSSQFIRDYISHNIIGINFDVPNQNPNTIPFSVENKLKQIKTN
jgi:uncharacterized protein YegL